MKRILAIATLLLPGPALAAQQRVDIALFPLTVMPQGDSTLARLADSCLTMLTGRLTSLSVTVERRTSPAPKDWSAFRAAWLAITGHVGRVRGELDVELRLIDVATGDELRSYMYRGPDASQVIGLGVAGAERIKAVVLERRK